MLVVQPAAGFHLLKPVLGFPVSQPDSRRMSQNQTFAGKLAVLWGSYIFYSPLLYSILF
jgi:hypothetical protein